MIKTVAIKLKVIIIDNLKSASVKYLNNYFVYYNFVNNVAYVLDNEISILFAMYQAN